MQVSIRSMDKQKARASIKGPNVSEDQREKAAAPRKLIEQGNIHLQTGGEQLLSRLSRRKGPAVEKKRKENAGEDTASGIHTLSPTPQSLLLHQGRRLAGGELCSPLHLCSNLLYRDHFRAT